MRYFSILSILVLLAACNSVAPSPVSTRFATATASPGPTVAAVNATSNLSPTNQAILTGTPPPTIAPDVIAQFGAGLRPEFVGDLALVNSPTIYKMDLTIDPTLRSISGQETVTYTNRSQVPLNEIYFRLFANYPDGGDKITVTNVRLDGKGVTPSLESQHTALRVPLAQPLVPGDRVGLALKLAVTIPVSNTTHYSDFTNSEGIVTLPSIYALIPAYDARGWHTELPPPYGDLVFADASFYDVRVTAPATTTVVASGSVVDKAPGSDETTWHYIGAPMRDFDINVSAALQKSSSRLGDITVNSYYLPQDQAAGQDALKWAAAALGVYENRVGPYPFKELDVVESPTTAGGIEYPGLVVISSELYRDTLQRQFFEFAVGHEVAHQWFYAQVGDDQVNTPWMDESLVQYMTLVYEEDTYGKSAAAFVRRNVFQSQYDHAKKQNEDKPVGLPVEAYDEAQYGEIVYGKGPLFFDAVRQQVGDANFFAFLQAYYRRFKYKIATPDDLRQTIDQVSGQNIDPLYNQWIAGK